MLLVLVFTIHEKR